MRELYKIGEVSKFFRIEVSALRYYDEIGLFKPSIIDDETGYRYYHIEQFNTLGRILSYKNLDIPLKDIKAKVYNADIDDTLNFIEEIESKLDDKILELQKKLKYLEKHKSKVLNLAKNKDTFEIIDSPDFLLLSYYEHLDKNEDQATQNIFDISKILKTVDKKFFDYSVYVKLVDHNEFNLQGKRHIIERGLITTDMDIEDDKLITLYSTKCIHCFIETSVNSFDDIYKDLYDYIKANNLVVTKSMLELTLYEFMHKNKTRKIIELYLPIIDI